LSGIQSARKRCALCSQLICMLEHVEADVFLLCLCVLLVCLYASSNRAYTSSYYCKPNSSANCCRYKFLHIRLTSLNMHSSIAVELSGMSLRSCFYSSVTTGLSSAHSITALHKHADCLLYRLSAPVILGLLLQYHWQCSMSNSVAHWQCSMSNSVAVIALPLIAYTVLTACC
jgi:hypothetical protein